MENRSRNVKVILVGESNAGKSAILHRFQHGEFPEEKRATIGIDFHTKPFTLSDDKRITLQIWDTAGQERFRQLMPTYLRDAQVAIIVFDLNDPDAHSHVTKWVNFVDMTRGNSTHIVLVGNKADLKGVRRPSNAALRKLTTEVGAMFIETSALTGDNVDELFRQVAHLPFPSTEKSISDSTIRLERSHLFMRSKECSC
ncbi:unnamed protein product, partial [Mesorhabditis belari]|uniref:Uncharacterized protein n=1 Tax=Mesorhabditis belari TaxID=2138241 RepID=A0AAF3J1M1_9BILA